MSDINNFPGNPVITETVADPVVKPVPAEPQFVQPEEDFAGTVSQHV